MSISSEISRISQNVTDSLAAVADKGVTVPSGSKSDDLPNLIAQIVSGEDGDNLEYGENALALVGAGTVGSAVV